MRQQPVIGRDILIGEGAHHFAVVIAVIRKAVGLHDRPVGVVQEHEVGGILDAGCFLRRRAAAERHVAAEVMAWPPISASASTRITEAPASRAAIAAGMPAAPEPITTMSASRCHDAGDGTATAETVPG